METSREKKAEKDPAEEFLHAPTIEIGDDNLQEGSELLELSLVEKINELETSGQGAFDSEKIAPVHDLKQEEDTHWRNLVARCGKRFEAALGLNLIKKDYFQIKQVKSLDCNLRGKFHKRIDSLI